MNAITHDPRRRGRAGLIVLLALLASCAGAAAFMLLGGGVEPGAGGDGPAARDGNGVQAAGELEAPPSTPERVEGLAPVSRFSVSDVGEYAKLERSYAGTGTLLAEIQMEDGSLPPAWTMHIEPSRAAPGQGNPDTRVVEGVEGQGSHEARDLPMGAYCVWVEADGYLSRTQEVAMYRFADHPENPGIDTVTINLRLRPMASVEGQVLTDGGIAADGVEVFLLPLIKGVAPRLEAETDLSGRYRFGAVQPGQWKLHVLQPVRPPVSPVIVEVAAKPVFIDPVQLPRLASIELLVVDEYARAYPDVEITGFLRGDGVGRVSGKTDGTGRFRARYLAPGPWRLEAKATDEPMGRKFDYDITGDADVQLLEMVIN